MPSMTITRMIRAPIERVFGTVADPRSFAEALPQVVGVEFLTDQQRGVSTRFRETRRMGRKQMTTELEVTECNENDRVRMVADSHGTVWDTVFTVAPGDNVETTSLTMTMDARAHRLLPRIMNPLVMGMIRKSVEKDMDQIKAFCERR